MNKTVLLTNSRTKNVRALPDLAIYTKITVSKTSSDGKGSDEFVLSMYIRAETSNKIS